MRTPPLILVVDDNEMNVDILQTRLSAHGYQIITARDGQQALDSARTQLPDLILLDIMMPKIDGITVCRELKADAKLPFMPIIMVTAKADSKDVIAGLDAGADEYLTKPLDHAALVARVRSMLRIKELHDTVQTQSRQLTEWNATLQQRVEVQVQELQRVSRLKRFLSPQLAELIVAQGQEELLQSHRRDVSVVFCDLRGFTAFSELAEPEQLMEVLQDYYTAMGQLVFEYEGTLERFIGDSIMILFNDPLLCPDHEMRAVRMALAMRERARELIAEWRHRDHALGMGMGIAKGPATIGQIGFEGRFDYSAMGPVVNLAARLCAAAEHDQILISQSVYDAAASQIKTKYLGKRELKGFQQPLPVYNLSG